MATNSKSFQFQMECYVFIDDSNLWIAGQKAQAKHLKDVDTDKRFRVDLGKFINLVTKDRYLSNAFLYGSVPPPNDTVWRAAREKNFDVKTYQRSGSGKEKEVDVAMTTDILDTLYNIQTTDDVIFITVTGDRDLKIPIVKALKKGVPVELWSWEDAMATEFRRLANSERLFSARCLDSFRASFSYTAYMSTRNDRDIDPAHAIVYRDVPTGKRFLSDLASYIHRLMRLFFITSVRSQTDGKRDLIIEFPKSNPEVVFKQLEKLGDFGCKPYSYPEYKHRLREEQYQIETTNRFEALGEIQTEDSDSLLDAVESSMSLEMDQIRSGHEESGSSTDDLDDWATVLYRKVGKTTLNKKRRETPCTFGDHCSKASDCPFVHTPDEIKLFDKLPGIRFKFLKTKECNKKDVHNTVEKRKWCAYAHTDEDSWCRKCKSYGHLTDNCKVKSTL